MTPEANAGGSAMNALSIPKRHVRSRAVSWKVAAMAAAGLLAGCGGGGEEIAAVPDPVPARAFQLRAPGDPARNAATAADQLMNFAERAYPMYFPSHQVSAELPPYRYRFYPETGVYLGVAGDIVYVMGATFGSAPVAVGPVTAYITPVDLDAASQLARARNCLACHAVDTKLIGPSFRSVSARYAGQLGATDLLANRIVTGGSGVWGSIPMPPNFGVTPSEAKMLAAAILTL